ncbi:uncharacterized protein DUF3866 [Melghirimyces profundicolus]|uniref:Uncharacterized protein DUF3866 n=1 Tax=Melghirimyces profundicolus TaxID=1242148 RepID=A0A2T6B826_9BACL|nr:DUF3866 family protein [Melghirimyces profundicolus]PTX52219.1 uncharacterized protein DUF3866 [Melghirimyces profundicolus]
MILWERGAVIRILEEEVGVQWLAVQIEATGEEGQAVHYPALFGRCKTGDEVWLNTTAVRLGLGSGGVHFVGGMIGRNPDPAPLTGHIMKLRYTPWQLALATGEEQNSRWHGTLKKVRSLGGIPVLIGELHSMLPAAVTTWRCLAEGQDLRIGYVMTDGGALPAPFSRHVRRLKSLGWLAGTVTAGHAFGGDLEAVNLYSALLLARHALKSDLIMVAMGPGITGTGTPYGFSGVEQGQAVNAVHSLEGLPVLIPRIQENDSRGRHRGLSHHTVTNLSSVALAPAVVPLPRPLPARVRDEVQALQDRSLNHHWISVSVTKEEAIRWLESYPGPLRTMGRGIGEDPLFYRTICASARAALELRSLIRAGYNADDAVRRLKIKGV